MKIIASTKQFTLRYVQKHVIPPVAARYLGSHIHPIRPKIHHLYASRDRDSLWWRVSVKQIQQYKRVVRSWSARRAKIAFRQALQDRGFDAEGRRLPLESGSHTTGDMPEGNEGNLTGSLEIVVHPQSILESYSVIQSDMHSLLDSLVEKRYAASHRKGDKS
ncbi:hypothetical protein BDV59DRAFT_167558 [Aspergillus ambiguus]|uniref:uncharacterized protein n=1 Tax=Aspergillus ambiguus TaxID=176160 RepID=UPI003CCCC013